MLGEFIVAAQQLGRGARFSRLVSSLLSIQPVQISIHHRNNGTSMTNKFMGILTLRQPGPPRSVNIGSERARLRRPQQLSSHSLLTSRVLRRINSAKQFVQYPTGYFTIALAVKRNNVYSNLVHRVKHHPRSEQTYKTKQITVHIPQVTATRIQFWVSVRGLTSH